VPEISVRLIAILAQSLAESGDAPGAATKLEALGDLYKANDAVALQLATELMDLSQDEILSLLRRAVQVAYSEFERLSSRLGLAKHLFGFGETESALREVDSMIADSSANAGNRLMLAEALTLRWEITRDDEHFGEAKTVLESLDPQEHWEPLARLLIEHGDYDGANEVLQKPLELGDMIAHLLAVDVQLRLGKSDSARLLFLE